MVYDLIVMGGGPAGYLGAERAAQAGLNTLLIEKRSLGGVCLNEGCIPTKTMLYSAKIYDGAKHGEKYGVRAENINLDHEAVVARKNKVVKVLVSGVRSQLKSCNVAVVEGFGEIKGNTPEGYEVGVNGETYTAGRLLIATGSEPIIPPIPGAKEAMEKGIVLTNREALDLKKLPASLAIIGGGVIGLELASYFNSAGSKVTIIEMLDHIAGNTDRELSEILMKNYRSKGIEFNLNSRVVEIKDNMVFYEANGQNNSVEADKILMSIGRRPATQGIGLEKIGVEMERGRIKVDEACRTNIPGVYAAGDANGQLMLAHTAYRQAEVAVNNMTGSKDMVRYHAIPSVIYTNPEVASVGQTEESANQKGMDFEKSNVSMRFSGRYLAENEQGDGICKVLADKKTGRIIGIHMIGNYSSEIIYGAALMIEAEMRIKDIKQLVFPHPTVSEIIREAIFQLTNLA